MTCTNKEITALMTGVFMRSIPCKSPLVKVDSPKSAMEMVPSSMIIIVVLSPSWNKSRLSGLPKIAMPIVDGIAMTIIKRVAREICRFTVSKSLAWYAVERLGTLDAAKEDAMEIGTLVRTIN